MKSRMIVIAVALAGMLPLAQAQAQPVAAGVERAQQDIRASIANGVRSGALTEREANQLAQRDRAIEWRLSQMESDGRLSYQERQQARMQLDELRAEVDHKLSNGRRAYAPAPVLHREQQMVQQRIEHGIAAGAITPMEARRLEEREHDLQRLQARAQRDGVITAEERSQLRGQIALLNSEVDRMMGNHRRVHYTR